MTEKDFWPQLEFRVCRELAQASSSKHAELWCDGFLPDPMPIDPQTPTIVGDVWIGTTARKQYQWRFRLNLPSHMAPPNPIDWQVLLPHEDQTHWLCINRIARTMTITPGKARRSAIAR